MFHFKKNKRGHATHEGRERVFHLKEGCVIRIEIGERARNILFHGNGAKPKRGACYTGLRQRSPVVQLADTIQAAREKDFITLARDRAPYANFMQDRTVLSAPAERSSLRKFWRNLDSVIEHVPFGPRTYIFPMLLSLLLPKLEGLLWMQLDEGITFFGAIRIAEPQQNHAKSSIVPVFRGRTAVRKTLRMHRRINDLAEDDEPPLRDLSRMEVITRVLRGLEGSFRSP
ncbi:hypothetical protein ALC57_16547 [Trachymyrmex cornetzi]|uniref:Uncharacterized protein n=1 Tax=Trachymyrmex cornetzi TaxID=471704 RepID=A0A195DEN7_9HYME|nr:hypothetical protein ALC57_16547 [Trachymyrmex cornetzi]